VKQITRQFKASLAEYPEEGCGSKRAVLPAMMMMNGIKGIIVKFGSQFLAKHPISHTPKQHLDSYTSQNGRGGYKCN
jgi:hypothetical protein